ERPGTGGTRRLPSAHRRRPGRVGLRRRGSRTASRGRAGSRTKGRRPKRAEHPQGPRREARAGRPPRRQRLATDPHARAPMPPQAAARTAAAPLRRRSWSPSPSPVSAGRAFRPPPPQCAPPRVTPSCRSRPALRPPRTCRGPSERRPAPTRSGPAPRAARAAVRWPRPRSCASSLLPMRGKSRLSPRRIASWAETPSAGLLPGWRARKTGGSPRCERASGALTIARTTKSVGRRRLTRKETHEMKNLIRLKESRAVRPVVSAKQLGRVYLTAVLAAAVLVLTAAVLTAGAGAAGHTGAGRQPGQSP